MWFIVIYKHRSPQAFKEGCFLLNIRIFFCYCFVKEKTYIKAELFTEEMSCFLLGKCTDYFSSKSFSAGVFPKFLRTRVLT